MSIFYIALESVILAFSCSLDTFAACFAYGSEGIHIPWKSVHIINLICSAVLGLSLLAGAVLRGFLPPGLTAGIAFGILFVIGGIKLLDGATKTIIRRFNEQNRKNLNKELRFSLFNFSFILNLYANPIDADINIDKSLSPKEAAALAFSLSLDGLAVGFGAALGNANIWMVAAAALLTNTLAVFWGCRIGNKLARRFDISWLSGAILIVLAVLKLF